MIISLCFVKVSFFPLCVVIPPGPGSICAGTVVKFLQPYLFIFPLVIISDIRLFVFVSLIRCCVKGLDTNIQVVLLSVFVYLAFSPDVVSVAPV